MDGSPTVAWIRRNNQESTLWAEDLTNKYEREEQHFQSIKFGQREQRSASYRRRLGYYLGHTKVDELGVEKMPFLFFLKVQGIVTTITTKVF